MFADHYVIHRVRVSAPHVCSNSSLAVVTITNLSDWSVLVQMLDSSPAARSKKREKKRKKLERIHDVWEQMASGQANIVILFCQRSIH